MIVLIANNDLDLLALRAAVEDLPHGFPPVRAHGGVGLTPETPVPDIDGARAVLVRLLKGRAAWEQPLDELRQRCLAEGIALLVFGGEATVDAELTALSTVPAGIVTEAFAYLARGGPANLAHLLRFVADTVLLEGFGFDPPADMPMCGLVGRPRPEDPDRPTIAVVTYRANVLAGNTLPVEQLCDAIERRGANARPVFAYSLRNDPAAIDLLRGADVVVTTTWAAGGSVPTADEAWSSPLDVLDVPVLQAVASTTDTATWADSSGGLSPLDVALGVAIPEFDGRIIGPPLSFKEVVDDGDQLGVALAAHRAVPDRVERIAGIATRLARLRHLDNADKRVGIVLTAYPTKRSRIGNAVALDTPASLLRVLDALATAGYKVAEVPDDSDAFMARLADGLTYDRPSLSPDQLALAVGSLSVDEYIEWFATLPATLRHQIEASWGPAPGTVSVHGDDLVFAGVDLGHVVVAVQPPRGFGEDPIGTYHAPDLPPPHHYLAFYRWLDVGFGADALVHMGKHGTLEWLPGKGVGPSAACIPDACLGDLPLLYPFVVNDPGEGTQAKRRTHAVIVDHLPPPMTRAETYDELSRVERLLDEHAKIESLDPSKLPAIRGQLWDLLVTSELARDLGVATMPDPDDFAGMINHVDGYLCSLKDAQIRGGLHVLGAAPAGEALVDTILAITRQPQGPVPSLRATVAGELGLDLDRDVDRLEDECRRRVEAGAGEAGADPTLGWVWSTLVPALVRTPDELRNLLAGLDGRHVPAGPSGAPTRGGAHVLPTGRNFYSVDPKAIPSALAWDVGRALADRLVERHVAETGACPRVVGLVVWGTANMRTQGDDVAEALALLGVRPVWHPHSGRVEGLEVMSLTELGRPRVDVTIRISGFFRDAFPGVVALLDDAVGLVAALVDESAEDNPVAAAGMADARVFGPGPGSYGSGIWQAIETRSWRTRADLADVYLAWSGFAYRRSEFGVAAPDQVRRRFAAIDVAVKNQDNREHDIFDGDDYFQDHGGMIAAAAELSGREPRAWFGDSADPSRPVVRSLAEEAARVVRTRVLNPKWLAAMRRHGYKGAFEVAATVDYLFGYDATAGVVEDWMYERVTQAYVADPVMREFYEQSNPWALRTICERLLEADERDLWSASDESRATLRAGLLAAEGLEERRT
ncbi:MAG: cobaltochelatase CobN [Actinomycetota bacterium]|jgi:cobaltochelatase CobN|nr:cobaltochelatase CobN [Actinomycetota bacterium]